MWCPGSGVVLDRIDLTAYSFLLTVLPVKSDSDAMSYLQSYQGLISDISLVY